MDIYLLASSFLNLWGKKWLHKVEIQKMYKSELQ